MPRALVCMSDASENGLLLARVLIPPARLSGLREASPWCWIDGPHTVHHRAVTASFHIWLSSWSAGARQARLCFYHKTRCKEDPWHLCLKTLGAVLLTDAQVPLGAWINYPGQKRAVAALSRAREARGQRGFLWGLQQSRLTAPSLGSRWQVCTKTSHWKLPGFLPEKHSGAEGRIGEDRRDCLRRGEKSIKAGVRKSRKEFGEKGVVCRAKLRGEVWRRNRTLAPLA